MKSRWWAFPKGWIDKAKQYSYPKGGQYNPDETVSIEDGKLKVVMKNDGEENHGATLIPKATAGQTYGRYAVRFKTDATPGYRISLNLAPVDESVCLGCVISFPEMELDREMKGAVRRFIQQSIFPVKDQYLTKQKAGKWHTAVIEWSPGKVEFFLDGKKLKGIDPNGNPIETSTLNIPDQPMVWFLQFESALDDRAKKKQVVAENNSTATVVIDWVAAYTYKGENNQAKSN